MPVRKDKQDVRDDSPDFPLLYGIAFRDSVYDYSILAERADVEPY